MGRFLFRCDISPAVGMGHFSRCLALAQELKDLGGTLFFTCRLKDLAVPGELKRLCADWTLQDWSATPEADAQDVIRLCLENRIDIAVIDHYRADAAYQCALHEAGVRWLQFDGRARMPFWADWVLNPRLDARPEAYLPRRQRPETQFLLGPAYAFLRREFNAIDPAVGSIENVEKILITFGGGDDRGGIEFCLKATETLFPTIKRVVLTTSKNPRLDTIARWMQHSKAAGELLVDEPAIARQMAAADIGIVSGGMTTFETTAMGLPCLIIQIAENQKLNARAWHAAGVARNMGSLDALTPKVLRQGLRTLVENPEERKQLVEAGKALVDCKGTRRVARILTQAC